jgi:hypothetical protein
MRKVILDIAASRDGRIEGPYVAGGLKGQVMRDTRDMIARGAVVLAALLAITCAAATDSVPSSPSSSGRQAVLAPIDGVDVRVLESDPPQYMLSVQAGLPSGCAERNRHEVQRLADGITVTVLNWMPTGTPACTNIYGSYELNINLGRDFRSGTMYSVSVNDKRTTFVAQ